MDRPRNSQVSLVTLTICLHLVVLASLPFVQAVGLPAAVIFELNSENSSFFSLAELDEDLFLVSIASMAIASVVFSKLKPALLKYQAADLLPQFPPPKRP